MCELSCMARVGKRPTRHAGLSHVRAEAIGPDQHVHAAPLGPFPCHAAHKAHPKTNAAAPPSTSSMAHSTLAKYPNGCPSQQCLWCTLRCFHMWSCVATGYRQHSSCKTHMLIQPTPVSAMASCPSLPSDTLFTPAAEHPSCLHQASSPQSSPSQVGV